jgi:hypothetical protein
VRNKAHLVVQGFS